MIKEELSATTKSITEASKQTYAQITNDRQKQINIIAQNQKQEEEREQADIKSRKNNIIIHGIQEDKDETEDEQKREDDKEVKELLKDIFDTNEEHLKKTRAAKMQINISSANDKIARLSKSLFRP